MKGAPMGLWMQAATQSVAATSDDLCGSIGSKRGVVASTTDRMISGHSELER